MRSSGSTRGGGCRRLPVLLGDVFCLPCCSDTSRRLCGWRLSLCLPVSCDLQGLLRRSVDVAPLCVPGRAWCAPARRPPLLPSRRGQATGRGLGWALSLPHPQAAQALSSSGVSDKFRLRARPLLMITLWPYSGMITFPRPAGSMEGMFLWTLFILSPWLGSWQDPRPSGSVLSHTLLAFPASASLGRLVWALGLLGLGLPSDLVSSGDPGRTVDSQCIQLFSFWEDDRGDLQAPQVSDQKLEVQDTA